MSIEENKFVKSNVKDGIAAIDVSDKKFDSKAILAGRDPSCSSMPIYMANVGKDFYSRHHNPTTTALQDCVKSLENGNWAESTACGISAITQVFMTLLKKGDRLLTHTCVYDWVDTFVHHQAPRIGVHAGQVDMRDLTALKNQIKEYPPQVIHFEPLSNPSMEVLNVPEIIKMAHDFGAMVVVDSTWLTPALMRPMEYGADIVVHSLTKYMGGHGDAMGGVVVANNKKFMDDLAYTKSIFGGTLSPFNAYNILKGLGTLSIRMKQHSENAMKVAKFLNNHPNVIETRYPGLPSDPNHPLAKKLFGNSGYSGMVSFIIKGGSTVADTFADSLKLVKRWISLGDLNSLVYVRWPEERKGIPDGYIRMSVGLENIEDIIFDLEQALETSQG
jgi:cystathionine beta-lyase/cystathionine gamma-synthase